MRKNRKAMILYNENLIDRVRDLHRQMEGFLVVAGNPPASPPVGWPALVHLCREFGMPLPPEGADARGPILDWLRACLERGRAADPAGPQATTDHHQAAQAKAWRTLVYGLKQLGLPDCPDGMALRDHVVGWLDETLERGRVAEEALTDGRRVAAGQAPQGQLAREIRGEILNLEVWALGEAFKDAGAKNLLAVTYQHPELGPVELILQRVHGKSVAECMAEMRRENDELRRRLGGQTEAPGPQGPSARLSRVS